MGRTVVTAVVAWVVAAGLLAGCSAARSNLGTSESACYLAIPTASQALRGHGRLAGVHLFSGGSLHRQIPHLFGRLAVPRPGSQRLCVFEYTGSFTAASVGSPLGSPQGRYAVVVVTTPSNHLLGTVILEHPPYRFEHTHIG
jgi:hypothetical protein